MSPVNAVQSPLEVRFKTRFLQSRRFVTYALERFRLGGTAAKGPYFKEFPEYIPSSSVLTGLIEKTQGNPPRELVAVSFPLETPTVFDPLGAGNIHSIQTTRWGSERARGVILSVASNVLRTFYRHTDRQVIDLGL